jgi:hypothetical protein
MVCAGKLIVLRGRVIRLPPHSKLLIKIELLKGMYPPFLCSIQELMQRQGGQLILRGKSGCQGEHLL